MAHHPRKNSARVDFSSTTLVTKIMFRNIECDDIEYENYVLHHLIFYINIWKNDMNSS